MAWRKTWIAIVFLQFHLVCLSLAHEDVTGGTTTQTSPGFSSHKLYNAFLALQSWKSSITSDPLNITATWVGSNVCSYQGVFCSDSLDNVPGQVVAGIDLNNAYLEGTLVRELSYLTDLSILHLNTNNFSGTFPDSFSDLISLSELDLSNNQFFGTFSSVLLRLPNLIYIDLRYNRFNGVVPDELFGLNLDAIFLNNNEFEGKIPTSLGSSTASVITFANNRFSGDIPTSIGDMGPRLKEILFMNNQLTGCIPAEIGLLSQMVVLDLSFNSLSGKLPDSFGCLSGIEVLNVARNELSGMLPAILCSLNTLANLTVSYNFFSGISPDCSWKSDKAVFDLSGNCIPGKEMQRPEFECAGFQGELKCIRVPSIKRYSCRTLTEEAVMDPDRSFPDGNLFSP